MNPKLEAGMGLGLKSADRHVTCPSRVTRLKPCQKTLVCEVLCSLSQLMLRLSPLRAQAAAFGHFTKAQVTAHRYRGLSSSALSLWYTVGR